VGLWAGDLQRKEPALPARHSDQDVIRRVSPMQLAQLFAALPSKQPTRISIARTVGELIVPEETSGNGFVEYRNLCELGGSTDRARSRSQTSWPASGQENTA
jgi:hypothetical protein